MGKSKSGLIKYTFFYSPVEQKDFSFKENDFNLDELQKDFYSLYQVFLSNKACWSKDHSSVLDLTFFCNVLLFYYQLDYSGADLEKFKHFCGEIEEFHKKDYSQQKPESNEENSNFRFENIRKSLRSFLSSLTKISKIREYISNLNAKRSQFNYSRGLASQTILYLQKSSLSRSIQELNKVLGNKYGFVESMNLLNKTRDGLTNLGISLYIIRFNINLFLMVKHVVKAARTEGLSPKKVFKQEFEKRVFTMANDLLWTIGCLITTYNDFFHIASSAVPYLTLAFLIADALLLLTQWRYIASQHNQQMEKYQSKLKGAKPHKQSIVQRQIDVLKDEWKVQCTFFTINIMGANIIIACQAISILCSGPLALAGLALFSMLGNALYNTAEAYKKYKKSNVQIERELKNAKMLDNGHHRQVLNKLHIEAEKNYHEFWKTLAFNVGGMAFIITATATSWPVAVGLTLCFIAYRLNQTYQKSLHNKEEAPQDIYRILNSRPSMGMAQ